MTGFSKIQMRIGCKQIKTLVNLRNLAEDGTGRGRIICRYPWDTGRFMGKHTCGD